MAGVDDETPLCLLLLDGVLEEVPFGARAAELNRSPHVVVIEPARRPTPALLAPRVAKRLAKKLPGQSSGSRVKTGRNERCPCGSDLKYKQCHGRPGASGSRSK